jgi:threonine dehydrogenase-like Zn-dependent dehydrogenase
VDEITVLGSRCGPFESALRLLETREVDPTVLISDKYKLEDALKAFEKAAQPGVLKVFLEI